MLSILLLAAAPAEVPAPVKLTTPVAIAYNMFHEPRFEAELPYILQVAGNPEGRVFGYDERRRMVRVSPDAADPVWLSCDQVEPTDRYCGPTTDGGTRPAPPRAAGPRRKARMGAIRGDSARGLPSCPGDPRCPKM